MGALHIKYTWSIGNCATWCNIPAPLSYRSLVAFKPPVIFNKMFNANSLVILRVVFHSSFKQCFPLSSNYLVGSVKYRFIEFFVFDYDSLPYLLSLFFLSGVTFPLVALDRIQEG